MPIYEYECPSCQGTFEELVRTSDQVVRCPTCGTDDLRKLFSVFARGSGETAAAAPPPGCGRCGDPQGPCGL